MKITLSVLILSFLCSCVYDHTAITEDLGNGYFYMGDGHESQILFNKNRKKNESSGLNVTEPEVIEYNYNSKYIIAKSFRKNNELFWIIDKELPPDSARFLSKDEYEKEMYEKGIEMELKKRK